MSPNPLPCLNAMAPLLLLLMAPQPSTGALCGVVKDQNGAALSGVTVQLSSPGRIRAPAPMTTDAQGRYCFQDLPPGLYTVTYSLPNFTSIRRQNLRVERGETVDLDIIFNRRFRLTAAAGPCSIGSLAELPLKMCECSKQLLDWIETTKQTVNTLGEPDELAAAIWPTPYWLHPAGIGPKKIGNSRGWWFRVYRPELSMNLDTQKLTIEARVGVQKTRGVLQFPLREADHSFDIDLPPQFIEFVEGINRTNETLETAEASINLILDNLCQ